MNPRQMAVNKIRQIKTKIMEYTHTAISKVKTVQKKVKHSRLTQGTKEIKNYIYQLRTKLTKAQTGKQN